MWPNPQFPSDLVKFTEEILNGKLHFLSSNNSFREKKPMYFTNRGKFYCFFPPIDPKTKDWLSKQIKPFSHKWNNYQFCFK